jgi:hypothetical protein
MTTNNSRLDRKLRIQRFRQLAQQHTGLVIASQLAAKQATDRLAIEPHDRDSPSERKRLLIESRRAHSRRKR